MDFGQSTARRVGSVHCGATTCYSKDVGPIVLIGLEQDSVHIVEVIRLTCNKSIFEYNESIRRNEVVEFPVEERNR